MKTNHAILCLILCGVLAATTGCNKTETPGPDAKGTDSATKNQPPEAIKKPEAPPTAIPAANPAVQTPKQPIVPPNEVPTPAIPGSALDKITQSTGGLAGLSQDQMVQGLKDALGKGLQQAVAGLGHDGGFMTNLNVKIPMPEKLQKVEKTLRALKQDKLADDFVATMNHAAEQAVPAAGSVFVDALKQMQIEDAKAILTATNNAATQYFQRTTRTNLYARFYPIVQKATEKTGVTAAYKNVMDKANLGQSLGGLGNALGGVASAKDSMDIDAYVTDKTLDGLFVMVAQEE